MIARVVAFGGSSVQIECDGPAAARLADFLFGDLPPMPGQAPHVTLTVEMERQNGLLTLHAGEALLYRGASETALARALLERTMYHLSDRAADGLVFHAAAVARGDRCVLLPGKSGAGKTTLAAWLTARGFRYLTDELVCVPLGASVVIPFVRPLNIRTSALRVLASRGVDVAAWGSDRLTGTDVTMARAAETTPSPSAALRPAVVVFPRYDPAVALDVERLSQAQAGLGLIECLINARNLPGHGFAEVTRLAREATVFRVRYHDLDRIGEWMETVVA